MRTLLMLPAVLAAAAMAAPLHAQGMSQDTVPAAVVQRFVDGAIARDIDAMVETLAEDVIFSALPDEVPFAAGRDNVRAYYARMFQQLPAGFTIRITARLVDGAFVTDFEQFAVDGTPNGQATWVYYVTQGRIQRAWVLSQPRP